MNRRHIATALCAIGLLALDGRLFAQSAGKVWRIGFVTAYARASRQAELVDFMQGLRELGYVEGRNLVIEWRFADGHYERLPAMAAELVAMKVDVIVAVPSPAIRAAQKATSTIPIVFPTTGDPVGSGFVASLARPGGNLTGLSNANLEISAKLLEMLREMVPRMSRVAILANPGSSTEQAMVASMRRAAQDIGVQWRVIEAGTTQEIDQAFAALRPGEFDALLIAGDAFLSMRGQQIADLALRHRLPSATQGTAYPGAGGLIGYGQTPGWSYRRAAGYVDRILRGANPAELPVELPTRFQCTLNLKTAKALGITIPQSLLLRADEVIQ